LLEKRNINKKGGLPASRGGKLKKNKQNKCYCHTTKWENHKRFGGDFVGGGGKKAPQDSTDVQINGKEKGAQTRK